MISDSHLRECLVELMGSDARDCLIFPITAGRCFQIQQGPLRYVVKLYSESERIRTDVRAAALARAALPSLAPRLLARHEIQKIAVWEEVPGRSLGRWLRDCSSPELALRAAEVFGRTLHILHSVRVGTDDDILALDFCSGLADEVAFLRNGTSCSVSLSEAAERPNAGTWAARYAQNTAVTTFIDEAERLLATRQGDVWRQSKSLVHCDLWSDNVLVNELSDALQTTFIDYEWARSGSPLLDTAKAFCRGFAVRDLAASYMIGTQHELWSAFACGYGNSALTDTRSAGFAIAAAYGMGRTMSYYAARLPLVDKVDEAATIVRSIERIAAAGVQLLRTY